jgi:hypothetical protein
MGKHLGGTTGDNPQTWRVFYMLFDAEGTKSDMAAFVTALVGDGWTRVDASTYTKSGSTVNIVTGRTGMLNALSASWDAHVMYHGHSNYGMGFDTSEGNTAFSDFIRLGEPCAAVNWNYMRLHQGHPDLDFARSEYGDNLDTTAADDPQYLVDTVALAGGPFVVARFSDHSIAAATGTATCARQR